MSSDFENQMQSYTEAKKHNYEHQRLHTASLSHDHRPTESTSLISSQNNLIVPLSGWNRCKCDGCSLLPDNSIKLGTLPILGGVDLHIHMLWLMFIGLSCFGALQISFLFCVYSFLLGGPILFLTVLIHELGHAAMAVKLGGQVDRVLLWPLGGLAYISFFGETSPKSDALVAIAGPLTHLPMVAAWCGLMALSTGGAVQLAWPLTWGYNLWVSLCAGAIGIQIALFMFNLVPAYPLDGGRLFGALLLHMGIDRNLSFQISACLGGVIGWMMLLWALRSIALNSFSYFGGWNLLYLSAFILYSCYQLWVLGRSGSARQHPGYDVLRSERATTPPVTLLGRVTQQPR